MRFSGLFVSFSILTLAWVVPHAEEPVASIKKEKTETADSRKSYDELYSEILSNLPQDAKAKVDSAQGQVSKSGRSKNTKDHDSEDLRKILTEKGTQKMDELPPAVKARVDKALSDIENRRKEKALEFKELNP